MQKAGGGEGVVMGCLGKTGSGVSLRLWTRSPDPSEDCECITLIISTCLGLAPHRGASRLGWLGPGASAFLEGFSPIQSIRSRVYGRPAGCGVVKTSG